MIKTEECIKGVETCFKLFMKEGLRAVSIEDIARGTSISKKELYEAFGNKEGVIREVFAYDLERIESLFNNATTQNNNAIEAMLYVHKHFIEKVGNVNPVFFFDLKKYYAKIGINHMVKKQKLSKDFILKNISRGLEEGIYRKNIDPEIVATLWISKMDVIQEQKWFPLHQFDFIHLTHELTELHLRSIANIEGTKIIDQLINNK